MTLAVKILLAQINPLVGDICGNQKKILHAIAEGKKQGASLVICPEMALTGYPPEDFLLLNHFVEAAEDALKEIILSSEGIGVIVGTVRKNQTKKEKPLYNTAAICHNGTLLGYQDKMLLPTYDVFDERRYFEPAQKNIPWKIGPLNIGVTICEDIWQHSEKVADTSYEKDPLLDLIKAPLDALINLSASPFHLGKLKTRVEICQNASKFLKTPTFFCNQVGGNDSLIFDGRSLVTNAKGELCAIAKGFEEELFLVDTSQTKPILLEETPLKDLYEALVLGVRDYFQKLGFKKACIGLSGGIDSALVACIAVAALGNKNVLGIAMPSQYSSSGSLKDASELAAHLEIPLRVIPIQGPFLSYLDLLNPYFEGKKPNVTEENLQARVRGMILMAMSNKHGHVVLSTGNKSELAMGYSTLYGDMCGGLAVISDLTKEQVYDLSRFINEKKKLIPESTLTKPPSAELAPNQKDTDSLPEYPIVDAVLKAYIEEGKSPKTIATEENLSLDLVKSLVKKIHLNEYKRRQSPPGLRVSEKAFSIGRRFPIVQKWV